ncbi:hypothetical protein [Legionella sainthelensi]|uniref:hypothetical protein n=1 Tax=Legionella sainthelensi TaxID=28087 RepID=UPI000F703A5D|nr:hypothetical protein [Legionella sainthelensi]VEH34715.1 zinc-dependent metallopeptidase [Legionella sainthelensi]
MKYYYTIILISSYLLLSCHNNGSSPNTDAAEAQEFIDNYTKRYVKLYASAKNARWQSNIEIKANDFTNAKIAQNADKALAVFIGSKENINGARKYLNPQYKLTNMQVKQLELILYSAANSPQEVADLVEKEYKLRLSKYISYMDISIYWMARR